MAKKSDKITVENINHPDLRTHVNRAKYENMRDALLSILPQTPPSITVKETLAALKPHLDPTLFPKGITSGWWQKTVQLDLEAKGIIARTDSKPLHLYRL